jgi:hypothetical protein
MNMDPVLSERSLPPVHARIVELRRMARTWLEPLPKRHSRKVRIDKATETAILSVEQALLGIREQRHLTAARTAMIRCAGNFRLLRIDEELGSLVYDEARRRIDQIVAALENMMSPGATESSPTPATPELEPAPIAGKLAKPVTDLEALLDQADRDARRLVTAEPSALVPPEIPDAESPAG